MKTIKVKDWLFKILKYSMLFAIMVTIVFLIISIAAYYVLYNCVGMDIEISALIACVISAITIVVLDHKKFHFHKKMHQHIKNIN